jgi:hypothetical protein
MPWKVPRIWEGGECFIIGGGPSMPEQFDIPKKVIESVLSHKAQPKEYSPYLSQLYDKHVIGVNASFMIGNWIDFCFFGDAGFFLKNRRGLSNFPGIKVSTNSATRGYPWVKYLKQYTRDRNCGISPKNSELVWKSNSGATAIDLAVHLGAKKIILLGFDLSMDANHNSHWHSVYPKKSPKAYENSFSRHHKAFPAIARDAKRLGVRIINANPKSQLSVFEKVNLSEIL